LSFPSFFVFAGRFCETRSLIEPVVLQSFFRSDAGAFPLATFFNNLASFLDEYSSCVFLSCCGIAIWTFLLRRDFLSPHLFSYGMASSNLKRSYFRESSEGLVFFLPKAALISWTDDQVFMGYQMPAFETNPPGASAYETVRILPFLNSFQET